MKLAKKPRSVKSKSKPSKRAGKVDPIVFADSAGIDIGAREIYVAVPADRDPENVRRFGTFTEDLHAIADWLIRCRIKSAAMEATGVYWIPLFQVLEVRGLEPVLVHAQHVKNVRGRKSDVSDCQWIQHLHQSGILSGSFRPDDLTVQIRTLLRHRQGIIKDASMHTQRMQKAFNQMNIQLHHVLSDITGSSGRAIIEAIIKGERDPKKLSALRDPRVKASVETIVKALQGDWRKEHLLTLKQNYEAWLFYQQQITELDEQMEAFYQQFQDQLEPTPELPSEKRKAPAPCFDLRSHLHRMCGVDLTEVPGVNTISVQKILSEIGLDMSRWKSVKHFTSWLGLCPNNKITGGKVIGAATRKVKSPAAHMFRMCAWTWSNSKSALGDYFRRKRAKSGAPEAVTAAAHKLARIVYHLLSTKQSYKESHFAQAEEEAFRRKEAFLRKQAQMLGYQMVPIQT